MRNHRDVSHAMRTGYATFQCAENQDTPEARSEYIEEHWREFIKYIKLAAPEEIDNFIEFSGQHCHTSYESWLN